MRAIQKVKDIVKNLQISLIDCDEDREYIRKTGMPDDTFINRSFLVGRDEIVLGIYDNSEHKLASFFHEVGHIHITQAFKDKNKFNAQAIERESWDLGYTIALTHGIFFSEEIRKWADEQIDSYEIVAYECLLCGRNKFLRPGPHTCGGLYRKRGLKWSPITKAIRNGKT